MKKTNPDFKLLQKIRSRHQEKQKKRKFNYRKNNKLSSYNELLAQTLRRNNITMPESCSFLPNHVDKALQTIELIHNTVDSGKKVLLDFSMTTHLTANFCTYLFSEIYRLVSSHNKSCIFFNLKQMAPNIKNLIKGAGLLRLTHGISPNLKDGLPPIISGTSFNNDVIKIIDFVVEEAVLRGELSPEKRAHAESLVSRAISEAVLNVDYHAYPNTEKEKRTWWLTAAIIGNDLYIALCDRGVGIPTTLPRQAWYEKLMGLLPINDDATMIQAAMTYTRTSVKKEFNSKRNGRGLGTKDMQSLVLESQEGSLVVISNHGYYLLKGSDSSETLLNLAKPLDGTSINWKVPLGN